nr:MAG TPA: hypothetical protein [Caudoviricetes sp.]
MLACCCLACRASLQRAAPARFRPAARALL